MSAANAEVSRDNPEMLFVTAFAGILDLETGELDYCNAGHENPYLLPPAGDSIQRIEDGSGPPLCSVEDFAYRGARRQLRPGELLCVISDGVTEAQGVKTDFYGSARVRQVLLGLQGRAKTAHDVVETLRADVKAFAAGVEQVDDITILVLRWNGTRGR
jgi:serine phosphatase RsbU (regulator of sigma subunit)